MYNIYMYMLYKNTNFWLEKSDTKWLKHNELTRLQNKNTRNGFKNAKNSATN